MRAGRCDLDLTAALRLAGCPSITSLMTFLLIRAFLELTWLPPCPFGLVTVPTCGKDQLEAHQALPPPNQHLAWDAGPWAQETSGSPPRLPSTCVVADPGETGGVTHPAFRTSGCSWLPESRLPTGKAIKCLPCSSMQ